MQRMSKEGLGLVKHFEGFYPDAYWDGTGKCWTIGWGHTGLQHKDGTVMQGRVVSRAEGEQLLLYDMHQFENRVRALVKAPLAQHQFDALVSFDFNTGALHKSTLLKKVNAGDFAGAGREFVKWNRSGGVVLKGLTRRRNAERALFEGRDWMEFRA